MLDSSLIPNVSFQNDSCEQILGRHYELHFIRSLVYRTMFTIPNLVLINIMACRVYRKIKFGSFKGSQISTNVITNNMMFNADPSKGSGMENVVSFGAQTTRRTKEISPDIQLVHRDVAEGDVSKRFSDWKTQGMV